MLSSADVILRLKSIKPNLIKIGVGNVGVFGSLSKGEAKSDSDLDILIDFQNGHENFQTLSAACDLLEESFPEVKVEVVTVNGLSPFIGPYILKEVVYA